MHQERWGRRIHQGESIVQGLFSEKGWRRFLHFVVLGLFIAVSLHAEIAVGLQETGNWKAEKTEQIRITSNSLPSFTISPSAQVQQAEAHYQAGQLSEAIALWQKAATRYEAKGDRLNQALVLSFLATAWADLGHWMQANDAIDQATSLLNAQHLAANPDTSPVRAQVLTVQGELQLTQGQAAAALETWRQAETAYRHTNDTSGILGSQINQARALQSEGLYRRATTLLTQVEQSLQNQPDAKLKVAGLRNLGKMLRLGGDLAQSRVVLEKSLAIALKLRDDTAKSASDISGILLSLSNTTRAQGETDTALAFYQQAAIAAPSLTTKTQVQLAQLSLLVEAERLTDAQHLLPDLQSQITNLPPSRLAIYARINLAQNLVRMRGREVERAGEISSERLSTSAQELAAAVQQAHSMGDRRAESYALGTLGSLYETTHQWDSARTLTQQALSLAQSIDAPSVAYQWQWQLGRVFCQDTQPCTAAGNLQNATAAYAEAVKTLQSLRSDIAAINQEVQFSFRESVEPVYRQFVELLLQSDSNAPSQENLKQAREVIEALQLAELDNFFREACVNARPVKIDQIDPQAAVIYPIILPNQLAVILALPNQPLRYHKTLLAQTEVERILVQMRQSLRPTAFVEDWLPAAQRVYDLLLRPVKTELAASGIKTLVFVPDGWLRSLPMAVLHDGQHYLIENYAVALTPGLHLLQPQPIKRLQLHGLLAGLSQARESFPALPNVAVEINQINTKISAQVLLNQAFTNRSLQTQIESTPSSIVHLATHGQFSSKAEDTFILAWDGRINVKQLDQLLRVREGNSNPIELLVLSACQTATGDSRAALGMAGVAMRSGARSTLASLWSVGDRSTALLMIEFYRELGKPGMTKAEALRRAQVSLLHQEDYNSPYYWSPFVLLGNWL
ncbi:MULTISPECIES: CHAT domain-containing protein [Trichocoleus]|uniref:CHAT domain-containing protein n=1 Tax=Trichocoleus desertorum GB2-A4 TaxID=2933944 RepID=A0ABV0JC16_9CYAN|nr:CHAT domain-containing protein [Trichocoleus sp. FACHB-46]MBD1865450.1 CHAT domain-containing protein [Trichocoleus sp. FACHB-46]